MGISLKGIAGKSKLSLVLSGTNYAGVRGGDDGHRLAVLPTL